MLGDLVQKSNWAPPYLSVSVPHQQFVGDQHTWHLYINPLPKDPLASEWPVAKNRITPDRGAST